MQKLVSEVAVDLLDGGGGGGWGIPSGGFHRTFHRDFYCVSLIRTVMIGGVGGDTYGGDKQIYSSIVYLILGKWKTVQLVTLFLFAHYKLIHRTSRPSPNRREFH